MADPAARTLYVYRLEPVPAYDKATDAHVLAQPCVQGLRSEVEDDTCLRLLAWLHKQPRRPAAAVFATGPLRTLAEQIEIALEENCPHRAPEVCRG